jgi:hypothetical protein
MFLLKSFLRIKRWRNKSLPVRKPFHKPKFGVDMAKTAKRREWTKDDVRELKTLARQKTPVAKIAKFLKRTPGATTQKAFTLGVSLDSRA